MLFLTPSTHTCTGVWMFNNGLASSTSSYCHPQCMVVRVRWGWVGVGSSYCHHREVATLGQPPVRLYVTVYGSYISVFQSLYVRTELNWALDKSAELLIPPIIQMVAKNYCRDPLLPFLAISLTAFPAVSIQQRETAGNCCTVKPMLPSYLYGPQSCVPSTTLYSYRNIGSLVPWKKTSLF